MQIAHVGIIMADDNELLFVVPIAEGLAECQQIDCTSKDMEMDLVTSYASLRTGHRMSRQDSGLLEMGQVLWLKVLGLYLSTFLSISNLLTL